MTVDPERLDWFRGGEQYVLDAVADLSDDDLTGPSLLPQWTRAHVVGHLARNADALCNLLAWARTGDPSPMYRSVEERADGIEATAGLAPAALRADLNESVDRLLVAVEAMPAAAWDGEVLTARGRPIPASEVPWMRVRESWIHVVDLDTGATFAEQPPTLVEALLAEIAGWPSAASAQPPLVVTADDLGRSWTLGDGVDAVEVSGPAAGVLLWLSGRGDGTGLSTSDPSGRPPTPPAWL
ncbi:MAG TPA: maleylpyruvate isomerase family mycothiol-dependent enzyme [Acidimicrobiales bacterium]